MVDGGKRLAFLEKAFEPMPERRKIARGAGLHLVAVYAQRQRRGEVFLDGNLVALFILGQIHKTEAATADHVFYGVIEQLVAGGQGAVGWSLHVVT